MQCMHEQEVQLILLDIMMPYQDGLTTTLQIRNEKNIPIIILSAKTEENDIVLGLNVGADDYIAKPYSPSELLARGTVTNKTLSAFWITKYAKTRKRS